MLKFIGWGFAALVVLALIGSALPSEEKAEADTDSTTITQTADDAAGPKQDKPKKDKPAKPSMTRGQENALESAESYIDGQAFSKPGLEHQLKFEDYSDADARFAVRHVKADWNAEAVESAEGYLDSQSFSRDGLAHQLRFEKFTPAQIQYALGQVY